MSLVLLTSASGAPGVTTTTLGLACTWVRPAIAIEADPVGGSAILAGHFRGFQAPTLSTADLVLAHRAGRLAEQFAAALLPVDVRTPERRARRSGEPPRGPGAAKAAPGGGSGDPGTSGSEVRRPGRGETGGRTAGEAPAVAVLPGPRSHPQARSALELWEPLSFVWRTLDREVEGTDDDPGTPGTDVFIDAGRLGMEWYAESLLDRADLILLVTRSDLPSLAAARPWAERAVETHRLHPETPAWAVALVGPDHPYNVREVAHVLGLPVLLTLPLDPRGAAAYSQGLRTKPRRPLDRALRHGGTAIREQLAATRKVLHHVQS
ncbi:MAG: hypothetical protein LBI33_03985 [Propionibacteriaceae bacterium]|jgi:hypothetical protein|nr:hypothetical protein [Propionibacteriaceae bacterium]